MNQQVTNGLAEVTELLRRGASGERTGKIAAEKLTPLLRNGIDDLLRNVDPDAAREAASDRGREV